MTYQDPLHELLNNSNTNDNYVVEEPKKQYYTVMIKRKSTSLNGKPLYLSDIIKSTDHHTALREILIVHKIWTPDLEIGPCPKEMDWQVKVYTCLTHYDDEKFFKLYKWVK